MFIYLLLKWLSVRVVCVCYICATSILGNNYNKSQFQSLFLISKEITECLLGCFLFVLFLYLILVFVAELDPVNSCVLP